MNCLKINNRTGAPLYFAFHTISSCTCDVCNEWCRLEAFPIADSHGAGFGLLHVAGFAERIERFCPRWDCIGTCFFGTVPDKVTEAMLFNYDERRDYLCGNVDLTFTHQIPTPHTTPTSPSYPTHPTNPAYSAYASYLTNSANSATSGSLTSPTDFTNPTNHTSPTSHTRSINSTNATPESGGGRSSVRSGIARVAWSAGQSLLLGALGIPDPGVVVDLLASAI